MHVKRYGLAVTTGPDGRIYAIGGTAGCCYGQQTVEAYDPATDIWTELTPMPQARYGHKAVTVNGLIYVMGGFNDGNLGTVESYNPATNKWTELSPMPTGRIGFAAVVGPDHKIYTIGGLTDGGSHAVNIVEVYDPSSDTWTSVGFTPMPTIRQGITGNLAQDGLIYVFGGNTPNVAPFLKTVEANSPLANRWISRTAMPTARTNLASAIASDGTVYVIGGEAAGNSGSGTIDVSVVEAYHPSSDTWTTAPPMSVARGALGATTGVDGRIYAIGGLDATGALDTVEVYTPSTTGRPPSITAILPKIGGNSGKVTFSLAGIEVGFVAGSQVKLSAAGRSDIIATNVNVVNSSYLTGVFDLTGTQPGTYDVTVTLPNSENLMLANGFTIQQGGNADIWVDFIGRNVLRAGKDQPYYIEVGNRGNVDLNSGAVVSINLPSYVTITGSDHPAVDSYSASFGSVLSFLVPTIGAGSTQIITIQISAPDTSEYGHLYFPIRLQARSLDELSGVPSSAANLLASDTQLKAKSMPIGHLLASLNSTSGGTVNPYLAFMTNGPFPYDGCQRPPGPSEIPITCFGCESLYDQYRADDSAVSQAYAQYVAAKTHFYAVLARNYLAIMQMILLRYPPLNQFSLLNTILKYLGLGDQLFKNFPDLVAAYADVVNDYGQYLALNGRLCADVNAYMQCLNSKCGVPICSRATAVAVSKIGINSVPYAIGNAVISAAQSCPPDTPPADITETVQIVTSGDPNDKSGSQGIGQQRYINGSDPLRYSVSFANEDNATTAAQTVSISDPLDKTHIDLNSVILGPIALTNNLITPPPVPIATLGSFNTNVDLRPVTNLIVGVSAFLNTNTGVLTWSFQSLDPSTGKPTTDPLAGFLPPGGNGSVFFTVAPKPALPTGTQIQNQATLVFDVNAPINTPTWSNALDLDPPISHVSSLTATQRTSNFLVQWQGSDVGSGVQDFTIYVSDNGGPFTTWLVNTDSNQDTFAGTLGHTYRFYSIARDLTGNVETGKTTPDTSTQIIAAPGDVNGDGRVDCDDIAIVKTAFGTKSGDPGFDVRADVNNDGVIDVRDLALVSQYLPTGTQCQ